MRLPGVDLQLRARLMLLLWLISAFRWGGRFPLAGLRVVGLVIGGGLTTMAAPGFGSWHRDPVLSPLLVQQIVTDAAGFRWVATDEGVYRYDGYEVVPLEALVRRGPRLPSDMVKAITFDQAGCLWIGSNAGLYRYNPRAGELRAIRLPLRADENPAINALLCHPESGDLWVCAGKDAIAILDPDHPQRPRYPVLRMHVTQNALFLRPAPGNGVWVNTDAEECWLLSGTGQIRLKLQIPGTLFVVPASRPTRLVTTRALLEIDSLGRTREIARWPTLLSMYSLMPFFSTDSTCEVVGQGKIFSQSQLFRLTGLLGARPQLEAAPLELGSGMHARYYYRLERDAQGTAWCYAQGVRGCYKQRFERQLVQPVLQADGQPLPSTRAINRLHDGRLLISTYRGLWTQAADSPQAPLRLLPLLSDRGEKWQYAGVVAFDMLPLPGHVVLADESWGYWLISTQRNQLLCYIAPPATALHTRALLRDWAGRVWGGAAPGLYQLFPGERQLKRYADDQARWPLHSLDVNDLAADHANRALWVATNGGLFWLRPDTRELRGFQVAGRAGRQLPTDALLAVAPAGPGRAWVGTRDRGLLLVDAARGLVRRWTEADGLPSHTIATLVPDGHGGVWAGTFAGLVHLPSSGGRLTVYREAEGFTNAELNRGAAFLDKDGTLWVGGMGGVFRVKPAQLPAPASAAPPRLLVSAVGVSTGADEKVTLLATGRPAGPLTLGAGPSAFLELQLALSDHFAPELARFTYRLFSADGPIMPLLTTPHRLLLRGLPPGNYEVEIRVDAPAGHPQPAPLRLPLHVEAQWWQWPVVWVLAAVLLVALGYAIYWLRLRRALREAQLRAELAANLHDEVGALLTRVNLLAEVLRDQHLTSSGKPDTGGAFDRLLYNSRAAVQTMRDVVWGIDSRADTMGALFDRMRDHLDQTAGPAGLRVSFRHTGLPDAEPIAAPLRQHLYLIFKEAVTNAVRHARHVSEIQVRFAREQGHLILEVSDNGQFEVGARVKTAGMGLRNMRQRAAAIGAELEAGPIAGGQSGGYLVRIRIR